MNKFDKIIGEKLAAAEYPTDHGMWSRIEQSLVPQASLTTGFYASMLGGLMVSALMLSVMLNAPDPGPIDPQKAITATETHELPGNEWFSSVESVVESELHEAQQAHEIEMQLASKKKVGVTESKIVDTPSQGQAQKGESTAANPVPSEEGNRIATAAEPGVDFRATGIQCPGSEVSFESTSSGHEVQWVIDGVHVKEGMVVSHRFEQAGEHEVTMIVNTGGKKTTTAKIIRIFDLPTPELTYSVESNPSCFRQEVKFQAEPGSNAYQWKVDSKILKGTSGSVALMAGHHQVEVNTINAHGCVRTQSLNVVVEGGANVFIPNSFSPDNNGKNDSWFPTGLDQCAMFNVKIYSVRDNALVYETAQLKPWTGEFVGSTARPSRGEQFIYHVLATDACGYVKEFRGMITVL